MSYNVPVVVAVGKVACALVVTVVVVSVAYVDDMGVAMMAVVVDVVDSVLVGIAVGVVAYVSVVTVVAVSVAVADNMVVAVMALIIDVVDQHNRSHREIRRENCIVE